MTEEQKEDWLLLRDERLVGWESHAAKRISALLGTEVEVRMYLPTEKQAEDAWQHNRSLCGRIDLTRKDSGDCMVLKKVLLPFDGVFLRRSSSGGRDQILTWNSWLGEEPGVRLVYPAGTARREKQHVVLFRVAFPDGSFAELPAEEDEDGSLTWNIDGKKAQGFLMSLHRMPMGPLWGGVPVPEWLKPAFGLKPVPENAETVVDIIRRHANSLPRFDQDDLAHRVLFTFPRWLEFRLCQLLWQEKRGDEGLDFSKELADRLTARLVPALWLVSRGALSFVQPNNALELQARITGVRRYPFDRNIALRIPADFRQNHPSFRGRICPIETPESELIGLSLQLARGARVAADGHIIPAEGSDRENGVAMACLGWGTALIPFAQHNDGARNMLGAKNLRQAVPVDKCEAPSVKTGAEAALLEKTQRLMSIGLCPCCTDRKGAFALGRDLLVAYMPWDGWNVDDAMVISREAADKMAIWDSKSFSREVLPGWELDHLAKDSLLKDGSVIASFKDARGNVNSIRYRDSDAATLVSMPVISKRRTHGVSARLNYAIRKRIPLGVGDKLMGRHGNKGVVAKVLDAQEMPHLPDDPRLPKHLRGKPIDMLLNPHGVLSRMNPGQLLETHIGWILHSGIRGSDLFVDGSAAMEVGCIDNDRLDHEKIRSALQQSGLDRQGCVHLVFSDGSTTDEPVLVGFEHIVRLNHVPGFKAQARRGGGAARYSSVTQQASQGRKSGGGQRLGEMEVWALAAYDVPHILEEMLGVKSDAEWSKWRAGGDGAEQTSTPPWGKAFSGAPRLLKDWLFALGIDMSAANAEGGKEKVVRFSVMDSESPAGADAVKRRVGVERRIVSAAGYEKVDSASVLCKGKGCRWHLDDVFKLAGSSVRVREVLRHYGWACPDPLEPVENRDGIYRWPVRVYGDPDARAGFLTVRFNKYDPNKEWLEAEIVPSDDCPENWPEALKRLVCRGQFAITGDEKERFHADSGKNLTAQMLLELLQEPGNGRSLGDFSIRCPKHPSRALEPQLPFTRDLETKPGSVFDEAIFGLWANGEQGNGNWGYVELPMPVDYPCEAFGYKPKGGEILPKLRVVPVLPIRYRLPYSGRAAELEEKNDSANEAADINEHYMELIRACNGGERERVQNAVCGLFSVLAKRLDKKEGFLRHEGLGRRVDRSFRLVITPNPELQWNQAGIPTGILWELMGDKVEPWWRKQMQQGGSSAVKSVSSQKEREQLAGWSWKKSGACLSPEEMYNALRAYLAENGDTLVLLNRQPTLHRDSFQAFHPVPLKPGDGEVLQISPLCCKGFAADFDGDEMVGHFPLSDLSQEEAKKLLPDNNLRQTGTGKSAAQYDKDFVSGLELVHDNLESYEREIESMHLAPCCRQLLGGSFKPGIFGEALIDHVTSEHGECAVEIISALSRLAYKACTRNGLSFGFYDLMDLADKVWPCKRKINTGMFAEYVEKVINRRYRLVAEDEASGVSAVLRMVATGANGRKQIRQIVVARGELSPGELGYSASGGEKKWTYECSLVNGMSWDEMFWSSWNARNTMCAKKLGAGRAGDLTRRLVFALWTESKEGLVAAQSIGERGLQVAMQGFHTGTQGIDIARSKQLFLKGEVANDDGTTVRLDNFAAFLDEVRKDPEYAKIGEVHFKTLWDALERARKENRSILESDDAATALLFQRQKVQVLKLAAEHGELSLTSPFVKILFDLFGSRAELNLGEEA